MTKTFDPALIKRFNETGMVGDDILTRDGWKPIPKIQPSEEQRQLVKELLSFAAKNDQLLYLKSRWLDEREYEDFSEYTKIIEKIFTDAGYAVKKISRSFTIELRKGDANLELKVGASRISVSLKS